MYCNLTLYSKNKKSLNYFNKIFSKICSYENLKIKIFLKKINKCTKKKKFTLLKSPHVNKTAQETFRINIYKIKYKIFTNQNFKLLIILKKIKLKVLFDIYMKISFYIDKLKYKETLKKSYNPNKFTLNKKIKKNKIKKYFNLFNNFGKLNFSKV